MPEVAVGEDERNSNGDAGSHTRNHVESTGDPANDENHCEGDGR